MKSILDTSVVVSPRPALLEGELAVSAATVAELHFGVLVAKDATKRAQRLARLTALHEYLEALPIDDAVATSYGQLTAAVVAVGRQP
ncbi:PIN domain-containing protein, partial [Kibdelosporangium lantanae]